MRVKKASGIAFFHIAYAALSAIVARKLQHLLDTTPTGFAQHLYGTALIIKGSGCSLHFPSRRSLP